MKIISILIFTFLISDSYGQEKGVLKIDTVKKNGILEISKQDTCSRNTITIAENLISSEKNDAPLFLYNGIILGSKEVSSLNQKQISDVKVIRCPESYRYFGYVGINGLIFIKGNQKFKYTTLKKIKSQVVNEMTGNFIYALNGYIITDSTIMISSKSVNEIEVIQSGKEKGLNKKYKNFTCLNVWTLTKDERNEIKFKPCGLMRRYAESHK